MERPILVAFAVSRRTSHDQAPIPDHVDAAVRRIEGYYSLNMNRRVTRHQRIGRSSGLLMWSKPNNLGRWPVWVEQGAISIATIQVPFGYGGIVGSDNPLDAAGALARVILRDPSQLWRLKPPFLFAVHTAGAAPSINLFVDSLSYAPLYHARFNGLDVFANRLAALFLFAGMRPQADIAAWRLFSGCGWFMADTTPFHGVQQVPASHYVQINDGPVSTVIVQPTDNLKQLICGSGGQDLHAIASNCAQTIRDFSAVWPGAVHTDLTAGSDSRVVASMALAAGVDVRFRTGGPHWEKAVVRHLLELIGKQHLHFTTNPATDEPDPDSQSFVECAADWHEDPESITERDAGWHHAHDGDFNPAVITRSRVTSDKGRDRSNEGAGRFATGGERGRFTGGAGELAKGHFGKRRDDLINASPKHIASFFHDFFRKQTGVVSDAIGAAVRDVIARHIHQGLALGVPQDSLREYIYLVERIRR